MFSSPPQGGDDGQSNATPAKTPSNWAKALSIFSTTKKQRPSNYSHVEPGTNGTTANLSTNDVDLSAVHEADTSMASDNQEFLSPFSPHLSTTAPASNANAAAFSGNSHYTNDTTYSNVLNNNNANMMSPAGSGLPKTSRLEFSALSSRMTNTNNNNNTAGHTPGAGLKSTGTNATSTMTTTGTNNGGVLRNAQPSSWSTRGVSFQNGTAGTAPSPWQGKRSRVRSEAAVSRQPITFGNRTTSSNRTQRYRPNAVGLVGSEILGRSYQRTGRSNPDQVNQALASLKDSFLPTANGSQASSSSNVYFAAGRGKVKFGGFSRPSRTPRLPHKRQRPVQQRLPPPSRNDEGGDDDDDGESSNKRRKMVSFGHNGDHDNGGNAVVTRIAATPFRGPAMRKGTPMPRKLMGSSPDSTPMAAFMAQSTEEADIDTGFAGAAVISQTQSQSSDQLPEEPSRPRFVDGATLTFETARPVPMDAVVLEPAARDLLMGQSSKPVLSCDASVSFKHAFEPAEATYLRPPSPVRQRKTYDSDDDEDDIPGQATKRTKRSNSTKMEKAPDWQCSKCETFNDSDESRCLKCNEGRARKGEALGWGSMLGKYTTVGDWKCQVCLIMNDKAFVKCPACEAPRASTGSAAPAPASGSSTAAATATQMPWGNTPSAASGSQFSFGGATSDLPVPTGATPEPSKFSFGTGTPAVGAGATATGGFTFGGPSAATPTAASTPGTGFLFGGAPPAAIDEAKKSAETPSTAATVPITFGATPSTNASKTPSGTPAPPAFGASSTADASATPSSGFTFSASTTVGTQPVAASTTPAAAPFVFGNNPPTPAAPVQAAASAPFSGAAPIPAPTNGNTGGFSFNGGQPAQAPASEAKSTQKAKRSRGYDLDGGGNSNPAPAPPVPPTAPGAAFGFGGTPAPPASATGASFGFGGTPAPPAGAAPAPFGSTPAVPFGNPTPAAVAPTVPTNGMQFGSTTPAAAAPAAPAAGGANPFTFGSNQAAAPAPSAPGGGFGSAPAFGGAPAASAVPQFGSAPGAPAPAATTFGAAPPQAPAPGFGFGGGGQANTFGAGAAPSAAPAYGANPQSSSGFGGGAPNFGAQTPVAPVGGGFNGSFGGGNQQAPSTGAFGATPAPSFGGGGGYGAPQTGGFGSTPSAPPGAGGFGGGAAPNTAPPGGGGGGFSMGTATKSKIGKRRTVRAKRPTRPA